MATISRQGTALAYDLLPGRRPAVVFLPGYASDMGGTKAMMLRDACAARGQAMLRLDYGGHGASGGRFIDGCIGDWTEDAAAVIAGALDGAPVLLVGSSMGGWIALLLALRLHRQVAALLLIAPAPDFTETMIRPRLTTEQVETLRTAGLLHQPGNDGGPPLTARLLEDGARHLLLGGAIGLDCPVRVLHGMRDEAVPWRTSLDLADRLQSADVRLIFIKDGDHRLSRPRDLALLRGTLFGLLGQLAGEDGG